MAMNISFKKGTSTIFQTLTKDVNTFYYLTDTFALYLGEKLIGDGVSMEMFNALTNRVKTIEDWKAVLPEYVTKAVYDEHITAQAAVDKKQTDDIAQLRSDLDDIIEVGGEPNKVDDVTVDGVTVVEGKVAKLKKLAGKNTIATTDIDDDAVTADKLANSINLDIAKGVDAQTRVGVIEGKEATWDAKQNALSEVQLAAVNSGINTEKVAAYDAVKNTVDAFFANESSVNEAYDTLQEIAAYLSGGDGEDAKDVVARIVAIESDINTNRAAWEKDDDTTYEADETSIELKGKVFNVKETYITGKFADFETTHQSVLQSGITNNKVSTYDTVATRVENNATKWDKAETAVQKVETGTVNGTVKVDDTDVAVKGLGSAAYTNSDAYDIKDTAKNLIGVAANTADGPSGVYAAIQGNTNNTVEDCVESINNITNQLTWGSF